MRFIRLLRSFLRAVALASSREPSDLKRRLRVRRDWWDEENGAVSRLTARETFAARSTVGRWRSVDPLITEEGWRRPLRLVPPLGWAAVVGAAWWLGSSRGRGPLAMLEQGMPFGEIKSAVVQFETGDSQESVDTAEIADRAAPSAAPMGVRRGVG